MSLFLRLLGEGDKGAALLGAVRSVAAGEADPQVFEVDPDSFEQVPGAPFAYWVNSPVRLLFIHYPALANNEQSAVSGGKTLDDFRWIRAGWEYDAKNAARWVGFAKGGAYAAYYADIHLALDWRDNAKSLKIYPCQPSPVPTHSGSTTRA